MTMPRLLDLFSGAGGSAVGYHRAGFDVVGVDNQPMPNYPCEFHQADAHEYLAAHWQEFDAIHASPPCQHFSRATAWRGDRDNHPDLLDATRDALNTTGRPYVIENVTESPLLRHLELCGSMFGLKVRRHRAFESNVALMMPGDQCQHHGLLPFMHKGERAYADALGCPWMTNREGRQAIPPAYTEFIGLQLIDALARIEQVA